MCHDMGVFLLKKKISLVEGRMNAKGYQDLISNHVDDISESFGYDEWIFKQDNAPFHSAKTTHGWFKRRKIEVMSWPSLSPDLNPIGNFYY